MSEARDDDCRGVRRLRVPLALAIAFVGTATYVGMFYGGCGGTTDPPDGGGSLPNLSDGRGGDGPGRDGGLDGGPGDAPTSDAPRDGAAPDTPPI